MFYVLAYCALIADKMNDSYLQRHGDDKVAMDILITKQVPVCLCVCWGGGGGGREGEEGGGGGVHIEG